jgi:hypothetical protein
MKRALVVLALGLAVLGGVFASRQISRARARGSAPTAKDIEALTAERTKLRDELRVVLDQHNLLDFANAPPGNIIVGVPTVLAGDLVGQMVRGLFSEVRLRLQNIKAHHEGDVKAKVVFTQKVGHFDLDVDVKDVRAVLKPGEPQLTFGGDKIGIRLPVTVADGRGTANVRFRWQGKGLAGAVCGDMDVSPDVSSRVKPAAYTVTGEFRLAAVGEALVAEPRFQDVVLKIVLEPSESTWATLASTVEDVKEDKNGICRMAIKKVDVRSIVQKTIAKGFELKLPAKLFKPISLPATVERSVSLQGRTLTLDARPLGLRVTPVMLWYGVALGPESAAP